MTTTRVLATLLIGVGLIGCKAQSGDRPEAKRAATPARPKKAKEPETVEEFLDRARHRLSGGDRAGAEADYTAALDLIGEINRPAPTAPMTKIERHRSYLRALVGRATARGLLGKHAEAVADYDAYVKQAGPGSARATAQFPRAVNQAAITMAAGGKVTAFDSMLDTGTDSKWRAGLWTVATGGLPTKLEDWAPLLQAYEPNQTAHFMQKILAHYLGNLSEDELLGEARKQTIAINGRMVAAENGDARLAFLKATRLALAHGFVGALADHQGRSKTARDHYTRCAKEAKKVGALHLEHPSHSRAMYDPSVVDVEVWANARLAQIAADADDAAAPRVTTMLELASKAITFKLKGKQMFAFGFDGQGRAAQIIGPDARSRAARYTPLNRALSVDGGHLRVVGFATQGVMVKLVVLEGQVSDNAFSGKVEVRQLLPNASFQTVLSEAVAKGTVRGVAKR